MSKLKNEKKHIFIDELNLDNKGDLECVLQLSNKDTSKDTYIWIAFNMSTYQRFPVQKNDTWSTLSLKYTLRNTTSIVEYLLTNLQQHILRELRIASPPNFPCGKKPKKGSFKNILEDVKKVRIDKFILLSLLQLSKYFNMLLAC